MSNAIQMVIRLLRGEISTKKLIKRGLVVGRNFSRQGHCLIDPPHCWLIEIGDNVTLATGVYILAHDASTKNILGYSKIGKVVIGNNVFIGAHSIVLPNVTIGNDVIIGCGSIVTKDIPDGMVVAGNPARTICSTREYRVKMEKMMGDGNIYGDEYTMRRKVDKKKKEEMNISLANGRIGFVK